MSDPTALHVHCPQCSTEWATSVGQNFKCLVCGAWLYVPSEEDVRKTQLAEVRKKNLQLVYSKKELKGI